MPSDAETETAFVDQAGRQYRRRPGRRPSQDAVSHVFAIRLTAVQRAQLQLAAEVNGVTLTEFCRDAIDTAIGECLEVTSTFQRSRITETPLRPDTRSIR